MANDQKRRTRDEEMDEVLRTLNQKGGLANWTSFIEELQVPGDLYPALMTGRPELLRAVQPRALTADEAAVLYRLIAGLMGTNSALRMHAQEVAKLVQAWGGAFKTLSSVGQRIERFANFQPSEQEDDDGSR